MALVILGRRATSGRQLATSIAAELPIVVFGPASLTLTGTVPVVSVASWLPVGAVAFADFVNGLYYAGGAVTTLEAILPGATARLHVTRGYVGTGSDEAIPFAGAFATTLLTLDWTVVAAGIFALAAYLVAVQDADDAVEISLQANVPGGGVYGLKIAEYGNEGSQEAAAVTIASNYDLGGSPALEAKGAFTKTTGRVALSMNGAAVVASQTVTLTGTMAYVVMGGWRNSDGTFPSSNDFSLSKIVVYPPKLDAALPALSTL